MILFVFKVFHGLAHDDLSELIQILDVRSSDGLLVDASCFRLVIKGDCATTVTTPAEGNIRKFECFTRCICPKVNKDILFLGINVHNKGIEEK